MPAQNVSYADLDALLHRLGFVSRRTEVFHYGSSDNGHPDAVQRLDLPPVPVLLYRNEAADASILIPPRPGGEPVQLQHLIPTRRQLIEHGLIAEKEFDRWLDATHCGDDRRQATAVGTTTGSAGRGAGS